MNDDLGQEISAAKKLLESARYAVVATVNEDGSPHNSPLFFIPDPRLEYFYWGSHPDSLHSRNILRTGRLFAVVYADGAGLYIAAENGHILEGGELVIGLEAHNAARARFGKQPLAVEYYSGSSPQRMWGAKIVSLSVNTVERDPEGHLIRDGRENIKREHLL